MKKILYILFLIPVIVLAQPTPTVAPAPPPASTAAPSDFGNTQNNIIGAQGRSFGGGSLVKPNPMLTAADFALIGSPTYETFKFRPGVGIGYSRINGGKGFGINAILTFDLSQQTYSFYYRRKKWYYHLNLGRMAMTLNSSLSVTRMWEFKKVTAGIQLGTSVVANGKKTDKDAYFVLVPYSVLIVQKEITLSKRIDWRPEAFITLCSPYYDLGANFSSKSNTFNAVVGNNIGIKVHKKFKLNIDWRMNMNTTPKWGVMHNILIGTNLKF